MCIPSSCVVLKKKIHFICLERWSLYRQARIFLLRKFHNKYYFSEPNRSNFEIKVGAVFGVGLWVGSSPAYLRRSCVLSQTLKSIFPLASVSKGNASPCWIMQCHAWSKMRVIRSWGWRNGDLGTSIVLSKVPSVQVFQDITKHMKIVVMTADKNRAFQVWNEGSRRCHFKVADV